LLLEHRVQRHGSFCTHKTHAHERVHTTLLRVFETNGYGQIYILYFHSRQTEFSYSRFLYDF
jgi:hypothetical protein